MMKYRDLILAWFLVLTLLVFTAPAVGQDQSGSSDISEVSPQKSCLKRFDAVDKKHTGKVSKDEFIAAKHGSPRAEKIFASKDLNHDGFVTKEEYCKGVGVGLKETDPAEACKNRFKSLDTNQDGAVSKDEFLAGRKTGGKAEQAFTQRDTNGDGSLTSQEYCTSKGKQKPKPPSAQ